MRKVIIIGASSGIGKGLALLYASKGWQVGITGRRSQLLLQIAEVSPLITPACFDVNADDNIVHLQQLIEKMGGVDVFIYCAGTGEISEFPDWKTDSITISTNVSSCVKLCGFIFNYFIEKGNGNIAIISSIAALRGGGSSPSYNASKAFVSSYAESLNLQALILGKDIIVSDIKPGFVNTAMAKGGGKFWVMPVEKVCRQIYNVIEHRKRKSVVTRRWALVAFLLKNLPDVLLIYLTKKMAKKRRASASFAGND